MPNNGSYAIAECSRSSAYLTIPNFGLPDRNRILFDAATAHSLKRYGAFKTVANPMIICIINTIDLYK